MPNIGHARTDKHLVNFRTRDIREGFCIIRVIRAAHNRLGNFGQINLNPLGPVSAFSRVITDDKLTEEYQQQLSAAGIQVSLVG